MRGLRKRIEERKRQSLAVDSKVERKLTPVRLILEPDDDSEG